MVLQWKGLPYGECTFETPEAISEAGGQDQLDQYEVSLNQMPLAYDDCKLIHLPFVLVNTANSQHTHTTKAHKPPRNAH